jgi:hypothetical protein
MYRASYSAPNARRKFAVPCAREDNDPRLRPLGVLFVPLIFATFGAKQTATPDAAPAACPAGMIEVEGDYCPYVLQRCLHWIDDTTKLQCAEFLPTTPCFMTTRYEHRPWAELLKRTFSFDVLHCDKCGGRLKLLALVTDPKATKRVLEAIGEPTEPPLRAPAKGRPWWKSTVLRKMSLRDLASHGLEAGV